MGNMPKNKPLDRYVEAGKEFTEASRRCLEAIAHDLAKEGEAGREHAEDWAEELVERGRRAAEQLGDLVRREVRDQIKQFNLATNQDVIKACSSSSSARPRPPRRLWTWPAAR